MCLLGYYLAEKLRLQDYKVVIQADLFPFWIRQWRQQLQGKEEIAIYMHKSRKLVIFTELEHDNMILQGVCATTTTVCVLLCSTLYFNRFQFIQRCIRIIPRNAPTSKSSTHL
jgi:hypothetical protein